MRTISFNVYRFNELSPEAQKKAIENYRNKRDWDDNDSKMLEDYLIDRVEELGLKTKSIVFSLNFSQGDHVYFEGELEFDLDKLSQTHRKLVDLWKKVGVSEVECQKSGTYHYTSNVIIRTREIPCEMNYDRLADMLVEFLKETSKKCLDLGHEYIMDRNSDESIREDIEANEYEFTENGVWYN